MRAKEVQEKYDIFMKVCKTGVKNFVPKYKRKEEQKQDWFNARYFRQEIREIKHGEVGKETKM